MKIDGVESTTNRGKALGGIYFCIRNLWKVRRWWPMVQEPIFPLRRRTSRIKTPEGVWVLWTCDGRDEISQVRNLSLGGLFVETASPRAVGATTVLDFLVQGGRISADAVVRHLNPGHGMGLKFTAVRNGDRSQLAALVSRLSRSSLF